MADISKITLPSGSVYNLKDAKAREDIESIIASITGGLSFLGETTTPLSDGATTNPIVINGNNITAKKGDLVVYGQKEFLFNGTSWVELGDLSLLGSLAYKNSASGSYTPAGSVSQPTFSGNALSSTGSFQPSGSVSLSAESSSATGRTGFVQSVSVSSAGSISVSSPGSTTTVNSITDVGTLPVFTATVANETLTLGFSQGTLPTKGGNTTVKTGDASYTSTKPSLSVTTKYMAGSFAGTSGTVTVSGTPSGTVSKPTFTGTADTITVS